MGLFLLKLILAIHVLEVENTVLDVSLVASIWLCLAAGGREFHAPFVLKLFVCLTVHSS